MTWCEHCRDHYPEHHYENDRHKIGVEYGPTGRELATYEIIKAMFKEWLRDPQAPLSMLPSLFETALYDFQRAEIIKGA